MVTPVSQGFTYDPTSRTYNNLTANVTDANFTITATSVLISEFRFHGETATDEFVEIYNSSATAVNISGWALVSSDNPTAAVFTVPSGTMIPAKGHYLVVGSGYSLGSYATGDGTLSAALSDGGGVALHNVASNFTAGTRVDAAGFSSAPADFREGNGIAPSGGITTNGRITFNRRFTGIEPTDTNNNTADFLFLVASGITYNGVDGKLGAPGPQNLVSPTARTNAQVTISLIDPTVNENVQPNRFRVIEGSSAFLLLRRTVTNNTGAPITQLRFRLGDLTTVNNRSDGQADLRENCG